MERVVSSDCPLCNLEKKTRWYYEDDKYVVCDCLTCKVPMVVLKSHLQCTCPTCTFWKMVEKEVTDICRDLFGDAFVGFRKEQRQIKFHWHWHVLLGGENARA